MKKRNKAILTGTVLFTLGGATAYATTNIFANLDAIKENYDITFNFAKSQKQRADELQAEIDSESGNKNKLQNEINRLEKEIERIETKHAKDISKKQEEIDAKQQEIDAKQKEVNQKQEHINQLNNELASLSGELAQVEAQVNDLLNHTNNGVQELTGGE